MRDRPVIGILGCNKQVEGEPAHAVKSRYVDAVAQCADAVPLLVPALGRIEDVGEIVSRLDGVLLTGSVSNVDPALYRGTQPAMPPQDRNRDRTAMALVKAARHFGVPLFGICRGLQEINVALGGSLVDARANDVAATPHHAGADADIEAKYAHLHHVDLAPGGLMARLTGRPALEVNSVHFQHVGELGAELRVEATAADGVIEAIASREAEPLIIAVQWHPEWRPNSRPHDMALWRHVGQLAARRRAQRFGIAG